MTSAADLYISSIEADSKPELLPINTNILSNNLRLGSTEETFGTIPVHFGIHEETLHDKMDRLLNDIQTIKNLLYNMNNKQ